MVDRKEIQYRQFLTDRACEIGRKGGLARRKPKVLIQVAKGETALKLKKRAFSLKARSLSRKILR